jgi:hypothetical protein
LTIEHTSRALPGTRLPDIQSNENRLAAGEKIDQPCMTVKAEPPRLRAYPLTFAGRCGSSRQPCTEQDRRQQRDPQYRWTRLEPHGLLLRSPVRDDRQPGSRQPDKDGHENDR